jgi:hypothetical protein
LAQKQNPTEKIGRHIEPVKAAHVARRVDAVKFNGGQAKTQTVSLITAGIKARFRSMSRAFPRVPKILTFARATEAP